jgi:predicted kinase
LAILHFVCGKAGAGKTTLARRLGNTLPAVVICEDEWIATLGFEIRTLSDHVAAAERCRRMIAPLTVQMLRLGLSVVFDFGGNTVESRRWVRSVFHEAGTDHVLHVIEADDDQCISNIRSRNAGRPDGIYWGDVQDDMFHEVTRYFVPPRPEEGFHTACHTFPAR